MTILYLLTFLNLLCTLPTPHQVFAIKLALCCMKTSKRIRKNESDPLFSLDVSPFYSALPPSAMEEASTFLFEVNPTLEYWIPSHLLYFREISSNPLLFARLFISAYRYAVIDAIFEKGKKKRRLLHFNCSSATAPFLYSPHGPPQWVICAHYLPPLSFRPFLKPLPSDCTPIPPLQQLIAVHLPQLLSHCQLQYLWGGFLCVCLWYFFF